MKVLLLFGLLVATVWAFPVADPEVNTSSVVVDYTAVAKDSETHEHAPVALTNDSVESNESSAEDSEEEKPEEPKTEAVKEEKELKPIGEVVAPAQVAKDAQQPVVEMKSETGPVSQDETPLTPPEQPKLEEKPTEKAPEAPLVDKIDELVDVQEAPIALAAVNADTAARKETKAEDEPLKAAESKQAQAPASAEEIKVEASELKSVEEAPKLATEAVIPQQTPIAQESAPIAPQAQKLLPAADPIASVEPAVETEKKERKDDVQQEPITAPEQAIDKTKEKQRPEAVQTIILPVAQNLAVPAIPIAGDAVAPVEIPHADIPQAPVEVVVPMVEEAIDPIAQADSIVIVQQHAETVTPAHVSEAPQQEPQEVQESKPFEQVLVQPATPTLVTDILVPIPTEQQSQQLAAAPAIVDPAPAAAADALPQADVSDVVATTLAVDAAPAPTVAVDASH